MSIEDFKQHSHEQRMAFTRVHGVFLTARTEEDYSIYLYSLKDFFVEIWTHNTDEQQRFVIAFSGGFLLEPYLERVNLSEISG